jgi:class 3 adenylate cyclase
VNVGASNPKRKPRRVAEAPTASMVRYVFIDVVAFTRDRSVEAQTDIVARLGSIARRAVRHEAKGLRGTILLPTGDGLCIALTDVRTPYDAHLRVALAILACISDHNRSAADDMRRFDVRVGIAENVDNLLLDVNGNRNVAGAGINTAQRVMSAADGGQILASHNVFESLRHRERFRKAFRNLKVVAKHGVDLPVYQFVDAGHRGLSTNVPSLFRARTVPLSELAAHLLAHAIRNEAHFASAPMQGQMRSASNVLLYFLARDSIGVANRSAARPYNMVTYRAGDATIAEQFAYYNSIDFHVCYSLSALVLESFAAYAECFHEYGCLAFPSERGKKRLREEQPQIWNAYQSPEATSSRSTA